jgi:hypothetical protein
MTHIYNVFWYRRHIWLIKMHMTMVLFHHSLNAMSGPSSRTVYTGQTGHFIETGYHQYIIIFINHITQMWKNTT